MYRNVYLQCYKTATNQQQSNIELLICHFNYAYVAMGSILNDVQYAVGRLLSNQASNDKSKQHYQDVVLAKEKLFEKTKKSIDSFDVAPARESFARTSFDKPKPPPEPKGSPAQEFKQSTNPTLQFEELFKLNPKPNTSTSSTNLKNDRGKSSSKSQVQSSRKPTPSTPDQDDDDILDHLFRNKK